MDTSIWKVEMADNIFHHVASFIYYVAANTLQEAVEKAVALQQAFVDEVEEDEGEKVEACAPASVAFVCDLNS